MGGRIQPKYPADWYFVANIFEAADVIPLSESSLGDIKQQFR
jgi:hypothetical protein